MYKSICEICIKKAYFWNSPRFQWKTTSIFNIYIAIIPFTMFPRKTDIDRLFKTEPMTKVIKVDRQLEN